MSISFSNLAAVVLAVSLFTLTGCEIDRTGDSTGSGGTTPTNNSSAPGGSTGSNTNTSSTGNSNTDNNNQPGGGNNNPGNPFNNPGPSQINADLFKQGNGTYLYGSQTFANCDELGFFLLTQNPPITLINCGTANFP
ncbi:MAG TPA: hypothetical protein PJ991_09910 [Kiritimatiellia bacterium]|nr:hypothetical protein [Kiritimatiellia bacterium]